MSTTLIVAIVLSCLLIVVDLIVFTIWMRNRSPHKRKVTEKKIEKRVVPVSKPQKPTPQGAADIQTIQKV